MRISGVLLLAAMVGGCTSVRLEQREGCWIRQTQRWPGRLTEELGPCARPEPAWAEDRLTRLAQECMAQADYRWRNRALAAWSRGEPLPAAESEEDVLQACMSEAARTMVTENEALETRLREVMGDRDELRASVEKDREHLRTSHGQLTEALGEAAKKPAGAAVATATSTSDGTATTQSDSSAEAPPAVELIPIPSPHERVPAPEPMRARVPKKPAAAPGAGVCGPEPAPRTPEGAAPVPGTPSALQPLTTSTEPPPKTETKAPPGGGP